MIGLWSNVHWTKGPTSKGQWQTGVASGHLEGGNNNRTRDTLIRYSIAAACALVVALALADLFGSMQQAGAATTDQLSRDAHAALDRLYRSSNVAQTLGRKARAVLVFPRVIAASLVGRSYNEFEGTYGEGALIKQGLAMGYYNSTSTSWSRRPGGGAYAYAVFLMTPSAEEHLTKTGGWQAGSGPAPVVVDAAVETALLSGTIDRDAYVIVFDDSGVVAGISPKDWKISQIAH